MASVRLNHPTDRPNFTRVDIGDLTIWFSYQTPIGFAYPGKAITTRENDWSTTTGKHLNEIDGGQKARRIPGSEFMRQLEELTDKITV
jgi:hypothetical protein